jgi:hypothetical protein
MRQSLADNQFLRVAQRQKPSLAAERAHLSHMVHIHDRIAVYPLKRKMLHPALDST